MIDLTLQDVANPSPPVPRHDELAMVAAAGGRRVEDLENALWPLPVCRVRRRLAGFHVNAVEVAGRDFYDYVAVLNQNDVAKIFTAIQKSQGMSNIDCVIIEQIIDADGLSAKGLTVRSYQTRKIVVPPGFKLSAVLRRHRSIGRNVRSAQRKLDIVTESIQDESVIRGLLPYLAQLHVERWAFDDVDSAFLEPHRVHQYEVAAGRAMVTRVQAGEETVAIHYGLVFDRILLWHTPVINLSFLDYSPLQILISAVAESCDQWGIKTIDLGLGDEGYKARFATDSSNISEFFIPLSFKGRVLACVRSKIDAAAWRRRYGGLLHSLSTARAKTLQRINRVRFYRSAVSDASAIAVEGYREIAIWRELASALRQSKIGIKRYQYDRIRSSQRFLCLLQGIEIVCYGWMWTKNEPFVVGETGESIPAGTNVLYDFVTPERHRNRGYYTRLLKAIVAAQPNVSFCIFSLTSNRASIAGIERAGYVEFNK